MKHELTFREDEDPKGYEDGLDDVYDCTCGETFQANGDVSEAFDHGITEGRRQAYDLVMSAPYDPKKGFVRRKRLADQLR